MVRRRISTSCGVALLYLNMQIIFECAAFEFGCRLFSINKPPRLGVVPALTLQRAVRLRLSVRQAANK